MKIFRRSSEAAFTMVEIALCLAIVGFALVAIIGVLPTGMNVQRDNRQETIINQDAAVWLDAIRNSAQGYDDLTNYVTAITNYWTRYEVTATATNILDSGINNYSRTNSHVTWPLNINDNAFPLTNGINIISLLSTPKIDPPEGALEVGSFTSNYVVAYVYAISGSAVETAPQKNPEILSSAFAYRMVVENTAYVPVDSVNWAVTNGMTVEQISEQIPILHAQEVIRRNQRANARDLRLLMRWPLYPKTIGNGRQSFRVLTATGFIATNDFQGHPLYFFQPSTYGAVK